MKDCETSDEVGIIVLGVQRIQQTMHGERFVGCVVVPGGEPPMGVLHVREERGRRGNPASLVDGQLGVRRVDPVDKSFGLPGGNGDQEEKVEDRVDVPVVKDGDHLSFVVGGNLQPKQVEPQSEEGGAGAEARVAVELAVSVHYLETVDGRELWGRARDGRGELAGTSVDDAAHPVDPVPDKVDDVGVKVNAFGAL